MPRVNAVYADNPVLTAAQKKRLAKERVSNKGKIRLSYAVLNVFQRYWWGQNDPLYAVLSRRGTSVQFVDVKASKEEIERLRDVGEEIIESKESTSAERRVADGLLKQIGRNNPAKKSKGKCGCGQTDTGATICGCVVPNPVRRSYWTAAPKSYDYGYTVDTGKTAKGILGATWRLVTTTDEARFQSHQIPRYQSGLKGIIVANSSDAKKTGLPNIKNNPCGGCVKSNPVGKKRRFDVIEHDGWIEVDASGNGSGDWSWTGTLENFCDLLNEKGHSNVSLVSDLSGGGVFPSPAAKVSAADRAVFNSYFIKVTGASKKNPCGGCVKSNPTNTCGCPRKSKPVGPARRMTRLQIEKLVWQKTPRDYRGEVKGKKSILVLSKQGVTTLAPLDRIPIVQLRQLAGLQDNPTCKYGTSKIAVRSVTVEAPWMRRTVRGGKKVWDNADSAARAVCKSKPSTAAKSAKMTVTYRYVNGEQVQWQLLAKCSREKLATRIKKTLIPAAGFDFPARGRKPTGPARQSFLDLLAYYDTGASINAPWDN